MNRTVSTVEVAGNSMLVWATSLYQALVYDVCAWLTWHCAHWFFFNADTVACKCWYNDVHYVFRAEDHFEITAPVAAPFFVLASLL